MIKTTVVGSYPVPTWLRALSSRESLRDAMLAVLKTQELAGIDVVADGELYRWDINHAETNGMIDYFVRPMQGIHTELTFDQLHAWRIKSGTAFRASPPGIVVEAIAAGHLNLKADYDLYSDLSPLPKKFTVTSPYMLAKTLADQHYGDLPALVQALADVLRQQVEVIDADVVQIDEAHVTGHAEEADICAAGINRVLSGVSGERAVHLCYGNYGGQTIQDGTYEKLVKFLNGLHADHLVLEIARRPAAELALLKDVKESLGLGIGVIDIKDNEVESHEEVARRIEHAADQLGASRIQYVHPDCGFWILPRSVADAKMRALVAGRDLFAGRTQVRSHNSCDAPREARYRHCGGGVSWSFQSSPTRTSVHCCGPNSSPVDDISNITSTVAVSPLALTLLARAFGIYCLMALRVASSGTAPSA